MAGSLIIAGTQVGIPSGQENFVEQVIMSGTEVATQAPSGTTTLVAPASSVGCFIIPPTGGATLTIKGNAGDTGVVLGTPTTTQVLTWPVAAAPTLVLVTGGTFTVRFF